MKRVTPQIIGDIIEEAMRADGLQKQMAEQRLCYLWPEIVGPGVNRYTTRRYVDQGILHVYLSSAALKSDLQYMRHSLVERLNQAVGANVITDIRIH